MPLDEQLTALSQIYRVLDDTLDSHPLACHRGCSPCCTQNVTMTTLEGYRIIAHLNQARTIDLHNRLSDSTSEPRFQPELTTNALAERCAEGDGIPEENPMPDQGTCPLLMDNICSIYPARPLACRTMVSGKDCRITGYAAMDPFILSVNNTLLQFTEHIDHGGLTGNLSDVLLYLLKEKNKGSYETDAVLTKANGLLPNRPLTILMVPPEHRQQIVPVLKTLNPAIGDIT